MKGHLSTEDKNVGYFWSKLDNLRGKAGSIESETFSVPFYRERKMKYGASLHIKHGLASIA